MKIKILVVTHKAVDLPPLDDSYQVITVGKNQETINMVDSLRDDVGENISVKNGNYSELTALYWAWKNLAQDIEVVGLVHYRRMFVEKDIPISKSFIEEVLKSHEMILPKKRNYYIETTWSQYEHAHNIDDLIKTKYIIQKKYPDYTEAFDWAMQQKKSHRFNMFIMKRPQFDTYMTWLFDILFQLEKETELSEYDPYNARIYGFISERLLDVWIEKNQPKYKEVKVKFFEKINWVSKGGHFLLRKFTGKKRDRSNY